MTHRVNVINKIISAIERNHIFLRYVSRTVCYHIRLDTCKVELNEKFAYYRFIRYRI
jgi:hypothetical protein